MLKNVILGIKEYTGVFKLMSDLKLWKYFIIPMLIRFYLIMLVLTSLKFGFGIGVKMPSHPSVILLEV
jgi:hypothetical protein